MTTKFFLSLALLVGAYNQPKLTCGHIHTAQAKLKDEPTTTKESREENCKNILGATAYWIRHSLEPDRSKMLDELFEQYRSYKCSEFKKNS